MPSTEHPLVISVIGGSRPSAKARRLACEVGRLLAEHGAVLVCGGLGGVMEAACRGAYEAGGMTIGILPGNDPREANPYVRIPICTGLGYARSVIVVRSGRAVIAVEGAYGTLSEIAHALGDGIPVVGLGTWSFSTNGREDDKVFRADSPQDAVAQAMKLARTRQERLDRLLAARKTLPRPASRRVAKA
ncbi:MAG: TIGR00725 family protein [Dehalococcoidia bacterium]|nr:TIGR00725 family protein [Dehalococcoidia bacterium]